MQSSRYQRGHLRPISELSCLHGMLVIQQTISRIALHAEFLVRILAGSPSLLGWLLLYHELRGTSGQSTVFPGISYSFPANALSSLALTMIRGPRAIIGATVARQKELTAESLVRIRRRYKSMSMGGFKILGSCWTAA